MPSPTAPSALINRLLLLSLILLPLASLGCAASSPGLTVVTLDHHQSYRQGFTEAYTSKNPSGDIDVVLIDQPAGDTSSVSVRQVMHIRILWEPTSDMKAVVSNASVKWYVIGRSSPQDVLQYSGIAFVSMDEDEGTSKLKVQNALLRPSGSHGAMTDFLGPTRLEGSFTARADSEKVEKILKDLKTTLASENNAAPAVSSVR